MSVLKLSILASGSKGNAIVVHHDNGGIVIDNGLSKKEFLARMAMADIDPAKIGAIFLTHDHSDHDRGLRFACDACQAKLYISTQTYDRMKREGKNCLPADSNVVCFNPGSSFLVDGIHVDPFTVLHDATDPVGVVLRCGDVKLGIATDLGKLDNLAMTRLHDCTGLVLESNYDQQLLMNSRRPYSLKRRVLGNLGHLDNRDSVLGIQSLITEKMTHLTLAHLSEECNDPKIVEDLFKYALEHLQRRNILLDIAQQTKPIPTQEFIYE